MSIEKAIYSTLATATGVAALVSTRIYPSHLPQETALPAISFSRASTVRTTAMDADPGLVRARIQVSCWDDDYSDTRDIADQVRSALQRFRGTAASIVVQDTFLESEIDTYDPATETYHAALGFDVIYEE